MRKRTSRRRWKARAMLGQKIPWSAIVDHRLERWRQWERRHDYMDAYIALPKFIFATGERDFLHSDFGDRRWMPLDFPSEALDEALQTMRACGQAVMQITGVSTRTIPLDEFYLKEQPE